MGARHIQQDPLRSALAGQYHAELAMLRQTIEQCPDTLWFDSEYRNSFWQLVYHTLFYAHLYIQPDEASFRPWKGHQSGAQYLGGSPGDPPQGFSAQPPLPKPYTREQVLEYLEFCDGMVENALDAMDLSSPESGFPWYPISKLEHQIANIRHIQHGAAQLADRLRSQLDFGIDWAGTG